MTPTNLRNYGRYIKNLLEQEKAVEAADHCRHILRSFPKHIQTYRLFGEANLELKKYHEASDIFQRLLSSVPDDFIAHIGMGVILEELGNLDSAVSHMSLAYELQPYNVTIQNELRRLYTQREGIEIRKLSLNRPALARMYARGGLYPQAIAELASILDDHPERLDLMVLQAELRYKTGLYQEALIRAKTVLLKLPYCLEAIRLLVNITPNGLPPGENEKLIQKYQDLDPYTRYLENGRGNAAEVPDEMVVLDWPATYQEPDQDSGGSDVGSGIIDPEGKRDAWIYEEKVIDDLENKKETPRGHKEEWMTDTRGA